MVSSWSRADLRGLGRVADAGDGDSVVGQVDAVLCVEVLEHVLHDTIVEVDAAEEGVAAGGDDLEDACP
jgi:2-polyprenyl-3-methyl-5-hydroxy-6-metoxy-1,4-benzoquinol methylase